MNRGCRDDFRVGYRLRVSQLCVMSLLEIHSIFQFLISSPPQLSNSPTNQPLSLPADYADCAVFREKQDLTMVSVFSPNFPVQ